jgi:hypothetical protein
MRFSRSWILPVVVFTVQSFDPLPLNASGGGKLKIGDGAYRFAVEDLATIRAKGSFPGALKFVGRLIPGDGTAPYRMTLTLLKTGTIYTMVIQRRKGKAYPESWNATIQTRMHILKLDDRMGGRVEISCEGPLIGIIGGKSVNADWSGLISGVISLEIG